MRRNWLAALCLAAIAVVVTGCPNNEECEDSSDCANNEVCTDKKCGPPNVDPQPDAGTDAGTDAGLTCSPACAAPTLICDTSSGAGVCKTCTATGGCAQGQSCDTAANNGAGVCVPVPATTSSQIATFLSAENGPLDASVPIQGAYVTYVKPTLLGMETGGFFLQAEPEGPAMYVSVADAGTAVRVGDRVNLSVTEKASANVRTASAVTNLTVLSQNHPVQNLVTAIPPGLAVDRSDAALVDMLDQYESELLHLRGTIVTTMQSSPSGINAFQITTPAIQTASDYLQLFVPTPVVSELEVVEGCNFTLKAGPMWRFGVYAQPLAYNTSDLLLSNCPAPRLLLARASGPNTVQLLFDRKLKSESVQVSDFTVGEFTTTNATLDGHIVTLTTQPGLDPDTLHQARVKDVQDRLGTPIGTTGNTATFVRDSAPTSTAALVINEIDYDNPGGPDTLEFVELFNRGDAPVDLTNLQLVTVNGDSAANPRIPLARFNLSETTDASGASVTSLPAGGYLVAAPTLFFQSVPLPSGTLRLVLKSSGSGSRTNIFQDGPGTGATSGDGVGLVDTQTGTLIDTLFYEGATKSTIFDIFIGTAYKALDFREGSATNAADKGLGRDSLHRLPNGMDTNNNGADFVYLPEATPGVPLPSR